MWRVGLCRTVTKLSVEAALLLSIGSVQAEHGKPNISEMEGTT